MRTKTVVLATLGVLVAAGCATKGMSDEQAEAKATAMMKSSFKASGQATLDRIDQDDMQKMCSHYVGDKKMPKEVADRLEKEQQALIKYPAGDKFLGDWQNGEKIAQSGVGKQFTDDPKVPAGANCYACHQLTKAEVSFGTIGPSLYNFGKLRGFTPDMQKYAYSKVYNSQAFAACSNMPRFGQNGILSEQQIRDVVALLMDPKSPVNQ